MWQQIYCKNLFGESFCQCLSGPTIIPVQLMANKKNMSDDLTLIYLPIGNHSKLTPCLSQSHFRYSLVVGGEDP